VPTLGIVLPLARTTSLLIATCLALCGCAASATRTASGLDASTGTKPAALRTYLRAWQAACGDMSGDRERGGDDAIGGEIAVADRT
jgi:hypothetical protein